MARLTGRNAIVTGGSRGIGLAIARALAGDGARVLITGTREQALASAVQSLGRDAMGEVANVRNHDDVVRAFAAATRLGGIDILVNNAGIGVFAPVAEMTVAHWNDVIETNITGVFNCCHAVLPYLRSRGGGWIINISSLSATNPFPNGAAYCASKAALDAFSQSFMQEVRHDGIRVATVAPGSVNTSFGGHQSAGADWKLSPDDVAQVVVDLVAHPSRSLPSRVEIRRRSRRERADMGALDKHRDALEIHETMMGQGRGRLAVAMDPLTDALAMIGQHNVYCQSTRTPGRPTLDIALVIEQIGDAKELVQTVIEQKNE